MARGEADAAALVARQHGVFTTIQARSLGLSESTLRRRCAAGLLIRFQPGVLRHVAHPETWHTRLMAACLSTGGLASHRSGAILRRLDPVQGSVVEVSVETDTASSRRGVVLHHSSQMHLADATVIDGIPVTGMARTLLDLASVVPPRLLESAIDDALRRRLVTWPELYETLLRHAVRGRRGCRAMRRLLAERYGDDDVPLSNWSRDMARRLVDHGLPAPVLEHRIVDERGELMAQVDLAYPAQRVVIELQSKRWHLNHRNFDADPARWNRLTVLGWRSSLIPGPPSPANPTTCAASSPGPWPPLASTTSPTLD